MEFASRIDVFLSTLSVAVQSKDGDLGALEGASEAVDIPKPCRLDLQESAEVSLLQLDLEASVAASGEDSVAVLVVAVSEEVSAGVIAAALAAEEVVLDTKVEVVLVVEEVGMAVDRLMATVMALQHPPMHLLDLAETVEVLAVVMVALL